MRMNVFVKREIIFDDKQKGIMRRFLAGEISSREAAKELGGSHQNVINLAGSLAREWYQKKKITL